MPQPRRPAVIFPFIYVGAISQETFEKTALLLRLQGALVWCTGQARTLITYLRALASKHVIAALLAGASAKGTSDSAATMAAELAASDMQQLDFGHFMLGNCGAGAYTVRDETSFSAISDRLNRSICGGRAICHMVAIAFT
eukprot:scaffold185966_cov15-Prasinocladus_malaysianus.AAC.1